MGRRGSARRVSVVVVAVLGAMATLGGCGGGSDGASVPITTAAVPTSAGDAPPRTVAPGRLTLRAALTGDAEVPGPGDGAGSGSATVTVDPARTEVCFKLSVSGIAPADKAHVHRGPPDQAGPVVVSLSPPAQSISEGCVGVTPDVVREMLANPSAFYVNIHNGPFPAGAVRGQLAP